MANSSIPLMPELTANKRIFVIDDDPAVSRMLTHYLESFGFDRVSLFSNARSAIERLKVETPDLILTDLYMPGIGGSFFVKLVRTLHHMDSVPILVVTSESCTSTCERIKQAGANDVLEKPVTAEELVKTVTGLLTPVSVLSKI